MAATTPLLSAAARRCSRSASSVIRREVIESHTLTLDGCAAFKEVPRACFSSSETFEAAGHRWRILWYPNGAGEKKGWLARGYMSFFLELADAYQNQTTTDPVNFRFSLVDHAGSPVPEHSRAMEGHVFSTDRDREPGQSECKGFHYFMDWKDLERSGCLKDDRFTVRCDISGVEWIETDQIADDNTGGDAAVAPAAARVVVPPSNLHEHLYDLLWKKHGVDVAIDVAGENFEAHGWLLKARAPVLEAELPAATKEKEKAPGGGARRRMVIQGMEPKVFKAMLHFVYTDRLPEMEEDETVAMAQGLLAAAHRYKLEKLKLMCEEMLCKRIDVDNVATTLVMAEEHGCQALHAACLEFIGRPGNAKAVMESEGFAKVKARCLPVMMELVVMKKLA
ncbi:unnamed protein product [Urochloa humidicola]